METTTGIDARSYLKNWLEGVTGMYMADVMAIPADKWTATFGGCTRPANELTADAISLLRWTAGAIKGSAPEGDYMEAMSALSAECATREAACAALKAASAEMGAALEAADEGRLNAVVTPPWQMDAPLFAIAQIAVSHIWYHDGQLNYIQCLLGDDKVHWMGD